MRLDSLFTLVSALFIMCITGTGTAVADDSEKSVYEMEEIVVTAKPIVEDNHVTRYGEAMSSVGVRQIDDLNAQDMPSALRRVPGVTISRYNAIGNYGGGDGGAVYIRGHGSGRPGAEISTMFDGIPRVSGIWTHPLMDMMSIDSAESIEIHKSARPVTTGNMAFSAINVVPIRMHKEGFSTRIQSGAGSYGTFVERLEHGGKVDRFDYFISGGKRMSDGHRTNSDGETESLYLRAGYEITDNWDVSLQLNHSDGWAHDPEPDGATAFPVTERFDTDSDLSIAKVEHHHGAFSGSIKAYYDKVKQDWREWDSDNNAPVHGVSDCDNYGFRLKETVEFWESGEIVAGLDLDSYGGSFVTKSSAGNGNKTTAILRNYAPYVMISKSFGSDIVFIPSAGVRVNSSNEFGTQTGWQGGLVVNRGKTTGHLNYAHAFNLPGVYAKVLYSDTWSFANNPDGWQELEAEYLDHYEAGVSHDFTEKLSVAVSVFHDEVSDALRIVPPPPPPPSIQNIGDYETDGVELTIDYSPIRKMQVFLGGTLMNTSPDEVPNAPDTSVSAGISYTAFERLRMSLDIEHLASRYVQGTRKAAGLQEVDASTLANCRFGWLVPYGATVNEIFISVENIADTDYEYRPGYSMPGRSFIAGIDIRI